MKKVRFLLCLALILAMTTGMLAPAAVAILDGDGFNKATVDKRWVTDRYEPEEFDVARGSARSTKLVKDSKGNYDEVDKDGKVKTLRLTVGRGGIYQNRPADRKSDYYMVQGKKLPVETSSKNTWTVTGKLYVGQAYFSGSDQRRTQLSVYLKDGEGNPIEICPTLSLHKNGDNSPVWRYYNPKGKGARGWNTGDSFLNKDNELEELYVEEGWVTVMIKCNKGVITYWIGNKKIGNCTLDTTDVYPQAIAVNAYNYGKEYTVEWDNIYLYDGSYALPKADNND